MRYALDATTADSPADAASFAGETIRAQTEIKEYSEIYENRIMYLSASRWYRVHSGICFDEDLCGVNQTDNLAFPPSGLFSRLVMREEYDPNHKPDETSLCYELLTSNDSGEIDGVFLVPMVNLVDSPICDWQ